MAFDYPTMITALPRKPVNENDDRSVDLKALYERDKALEQAKINKKNYVASMEKWDKERENEEANQNRFNYLRTEQVKIAALESARKKIEDKVLSETFSDIYIKSLPLDKEFIQENLTTLKDFGFMYIRKLGGMDYLKKRVMESQTPLVFLNNMYNVCMEQAKKMTKKRAKKVMNSDNSLDLLHEITDKPCDEDESREILKNIDTLGADELAELVKYKIVNVVKDEKNREKEEREFRTVIKNELLDTTNISSNKNDEESPKDTEFKTGDELEDVEKTDSSEIPDAGKPDTKIKKKSIKGFDSSELKTEKDDIDKENKKASKAAKEKGIETDEMDEEEKDIEKDKKKKKGSTKENWLYDMSLQESIESYNPSTMVFDYDKNNIPKSLMASIGINIFKTMLKGENGNNSQVMENTSIKNSNNTKNSIVMENPLNLDVFATYLQNGDDSIHTLQTSDISDPYINGDSESNCISIDTHSILTESIIQYGLLETAYTMKLIDVTPATVREQANYLLNSSK